MVGLHILMDGNNTAYRANCTTELYTKSGERTSAIMGVFNITHNVIESLSKEYKLPVKEVVYAWDLGHSPRRKAVFPEYKANRKKGEERTEEDRTWMDEFIQQANILYENLPLFGVKCYRKKGWEGDDLIYAISDAIVEKSPEDIVVIVSTDEDFHQLIADRVHLYSPIKQILYTLDNYQELMEIPQELFLTYKVLKGDSSDGIPGINGIGEKTAKQLVNTYGNLDQLLKSKAALMKSKRTAKIFTAEGLSILSRNNQLINLRDYVDLSEIADEVQEIVEEEPVVDVKGSRAFLMKYQLTSILVKYKQWIVAFEDAAENYFSE